MDKMTSPLPKLPELQVIKSECAICFKKQLGRLGNCESHKYAKMKPFSFNAKSVHAVLEEIEKRMIKIEQWAEKND